MNQIRSHHSLFPYHLAGPKFTHRISDVLPPVADRHGVGPLGPVVFAFPYEWFMGQTISYGITPRGIGPGPALAKCVPQWDSFGSVSFGKLPYHGDLVHTSTIDRDIMLNGCFRMVVRIRVFTKASGSSSVI